MEEYPCTCVEIKKCGDAIAWYDGTDNAQLYVDRMGMQVITGESDSFTATREGFWSQCFTHEKMYNYLCFVNKAQVTFTNLDTYQYAMQVTITKE